MASIHHTPGPWEAKAVEEYSTDPELPTTYHAEIVTADGEEIATVWRHSRENAEADASLMATAPDLLEALQELVACALSGDEARLLMVGFAANRMTPELYERCDRISAAKDAARAAIAKARRTTP